VKRKPSRQIDAAALTPHSHIKRREAVRFVASEVAEPGEIAWVTRNRVSKRITYDVGKGALQEAAPNVFEFGRLVAWARKAYKGKFLGWPALLTVTADFRAEYSILEASGEVLPPNNLAECHVRIATLTAQLREAHRDLATLHKEADELRRYKATVERRREQGRQAAERSRRPR
jgi:hypothetical protein